MFLCDVAQALVPAASALLPTPAFDTMSQPRTGLFRAFFDVRLDLRGQFPLKPPAAEELRQPPHDSAGLITRLMPSCMRSNAARSRSSCFLPAVEMRYIRTLRLRGETPGALHSVSEFGGKNYTRFTFSACRPFGPCLTSNSTSEPSSRER